MKRLLARFKRSKCCGARCYYALSYYCERCNQSQRFRLEDVGK